MAALFVVLDRGYVAARPDLNIVTREHARREGWRYYCTGQPCRHGHVAERYAADGRCVPCTLVATAARARSKYHRVRSAAV